MASVKIVGLVAAHFPSKGWSDEDKKYMCTGSGIILADLKEKFLACLESIVNQSRHLDKFYLSWSHDNDIEWDVESDVRDRFKEFQSKMSNMGCPCEILKQEQRNQQFQHYQILYKLMEKEGCYHEDCNYRLIFGDIDDIWHPKRVEIVCNTISASPEPDIFVIQCRAVLDGTMFYTEDIY